MAHIAHVRGDWCPEFGELSGGARIELVCRKCGASVERDVDHGGRPATPIHLMRSGPLKPVHRDTAKRDERLVIGSLVAILLALLGLASPTIGHLVVVGVYGIVWWAMSGGVRGD